MKFLVNNGTTNGDILLKEINSLNVSDLDIMTKYGLINKKFMAMDDVYSISDWAKKLIIPNPELPNKVLTIVNTNTNLDNMEIITETETQTQTQIQLQTQVQSRAETRQESYCKIT